MDLERLFEAYSKFGEPKTEGKFITLKNIDKWMRQAKVVDGKTLTLADPGIYFSKLKSKSITYQQFLIYLDDLAEHKQINVDEMKAKLQSAGPPRATFATQIVKIGGVKRLTDPSHFTGIHRERFDENGKGISLEDRTGYEDTSGYVSGYKNANTYDKTHR